MMRAIDVTRQISIIAALRAYDAMLRDGALKMRALSADALLNGMPRGARRDKSP